VNCSCWSLRWDVQVVGMTWYVGVLDVQIMVSDLSRDYHRMSSYCRN